MSTRFTLLLMFAAAGLGCSTTRVCAPGATQACVCPSAAHGAQSCAADGSHWEPCVCEGGVVPPPAAPEVNPVAPAQASRPAAGAATPPTAAACPAIRDIDWMNRSYLYFDSLGDNGHEILLRNGRFEGQEDPDDEFSAHLWYAAFGPVYGDLNGDRLDEAVITLAFEDGGSEHPSWVKVFTIRNCQVVQLTSVPEENPGLDSLQLNLASGLRNARIENGLLVVERWDMGDGNGHGSPHNVLTEHWQMRDGELVEAVRARTLRPWREGVDE